MRGIDTLVGILIAYNVRFCIAGSLQNLNFKNSKWDAVVCNARGCEFTLD